MLRITRIVSYTWCTYEKEVEFTKWDIQITFSVDHDKIK